MQKTEVKVINPTGLHARPAARFVDAAKKFSCDIRVLNLSSDSGSGNAKSILGILQLGINQGCMIEITADGEGEQQAVETLRNLVMSGFGET